MVQRILLLSGWPAGTHQYEMDIALRELGFDVFTVGNNYSVLYPGLTAALEAMAPGYKLDLMVPADTPLAAISAASGFDPDLVLYVESGFPFLPPDIAEAPCPTVGMFTEDHLHADWNSALFPYF